MVLRRVERLLLLVLLYLRRRRRRRRGQADPLFVHHLDDAQHAPIVLVAHGHAHHAARHIARLLVRHAIKPRVLPRAPGQQHRTTVLRDPPCHELAALESSRSKRVCTGPAIHQGGRGRFQPE